MLYTLQETFKIDLIRENILETVKKAQWFTVIADEDRHIQQNNLVFVLRYVNPYDNLIRQDFIHFIEYDIGISGSSLAVNNLTEKAYDGGRQYGRHY